MALAYILLAAVTWFMTGLIWFVQIVHYPLFAGVGSDRFIDYIKTHCNLTGMVVILPMVVQLLLAGYLAISSRAENSTLLWINFGLVVIIWALTGLASVPCFNAMCAEGFSQSVHGKLVLTNWLRTILWTTCSILMTVILLMQQSNVTSNNT